MVRAARALTFVAICCFTLNAAASAPAGKKLGKGVKWGAWSNDLFKKATEQKKLVILDLEAVWCHWCHVMEEKTYHHAEVVKLIEKHFIAVKVDQDNRPDISKRYEDWGWPATIFFDSAGHEISKHQGYIAPEEMLPLLQKIIANPKPEQKTATMKASSAQSLDADSREKLSKLHYEQYDTKNKGFGFVHKYLFGDSDELTMRRAWRGDKEDYARGKETLTAALAILDPVWGGAYQYSVKTWDRPHFEKIARTQQKNLFLYSLGYSLYKEPKFLEAADGIYKYLTTFLQDKNGGFYTSQDADLVRGQHSGDYFKLGDKERRAKGIPIIDKHQYARENGWFIAALCAYYGLNGKQPVLDNAIRATNWVMKNRALPKGGFRHDAKDAAGPYLGDTLEMGRAFLALYQVTADRKWLKHAEDAADFIAANFTHSVDGTSMGYRTVKAAFNDTLPPQPMRDENIRVARWVNLLSHYTGNKEHRAMAEQAMRFLTVPEIAEEKPTGGVLLADMELSETPVHLTVVGAKSDPDAKKLFWSAIEYPMSYKRIEWFDPKEGALPNPQTFPEVKTATLFGFPKGAISKPIATAEEVTTRVDELYR